MNGMLWINCKERKSIKQKCAMCLLKMTCEYFTYYICSRSVDLLQSCYPFREEDFEHKTPLIFIFSGVYRNRYKREKKIKDPMHGYTV